MKTRIKYLLDREKITSAQFASEIGIAPSSLHHIISGRNNPSLEVIQKILVRFPQINAEWLISGNGNTFKTLVQGELFELPEPAQSDNQDQQQLINKVEEIKIQEQVTDNQTLKAISEAQTPNTSKKQVSKIILLYSDGTFDVHSH